MRTSSGVGEELALATRQRTLARHVVEPQHHVLRRHDDRLAMRGRQDVVGRHHERARFDLRLDRQRHVHRHLVAVEVGVVRDADQRMELDRLAFDQHRLERLDAEAMQRRCAVEQHRMLADDVIEDVPNVLALFLDHLLGALDGRDVALFFELVVDERLEQLERHLLGQSALMQAQLGTDHDDRTARVIDALAEQVLPEASRLALEHIGERLERALAGPGDRAAAAAVVEQRIDGFLQHPLFVADDDVGSVELDEPLEPVVAVDHAPIEIVEIRGGETAAVERNQRTQIGRNHRQDSEDHPFRLVARFTKRVDDFQALRSFLAPRFARRSPSSRPRRSSDSFSSSSCVSSVRIASAPISALKPSANCSLASRIFPLGQQLAILQRGLARVDDDIALEVENLLQLLERHVEQGADARGQRAQEPDVRDRRGEVDMTHPLAAHLGLDDLDAALLAYDAAMAHPLVLAAVALVVLGRTENFRAEQSVALRLEGPVVDGLGLFDFAVRPRPDHLGRRDRNSDRVERERVLGLFE